jgi:N-methylhydantoinase B
LRRSSGGRGKFFGGDGIVREIEVLTDCEVTLVGDRRSRGPWGLLGGLEGGPGKATILRNNGSKEIMPGKFSTRVHPGERIRIETPGGGGWGKNSKRMISAAIGKEASTCKC